MKTQEVGLLQGGGYPFIGGGDSPPVSTPTGEGLEIHSLCASRIGGGWVVHPCTSCGGCGCGLGWVSTPHHPLWLEPHGRERNPSPPSNEGAAATTYGGQSRAFVLASFFFCCFFLNLMFWQHYSVFCFLKILFSLPNELSYVDPIDNIFSNVAPTKTLLNFYIFKTQNTFQEFYQTGPNALHWLRFL